MADIDLTLMRAVARDRFQHVALPAGARRDDYLNYLDALCAAIRQALETWRSGAAIAGVVVNGSTALAGRLVGVPLEGLVRGYAPSGSWDPYSRAVAAALATQMREMEMLSTLPGVSIYPPFAAWPGPWAPPTPNTPVSLMAMCAAGVSRLGEAVLKDLIVRKMPSPLPTAGEGVARAIAAAIEKASVPWLGSMRIVSMMASGPVPTFAPPVMPVGPVIGGTAVMAPGGLR